MTTIVQSHVSLRQSLSDAIRYWEPRRLIYNLVLAAVVLIFTVNYWAQIRDRVSFELLLGLLVLAVLANVCYCAAYVADIPMQLSSHLTTWRRWRWALWLFGVLFGAALTWYCTADEILPALLGR